MDKIRFLYSKTGKAKFISHLDLMAIMQRAFLRADVKLKYSEGFNPHPYMSVALPLSVGCESICELIDVKLTTNTVPDIKSIRLPDGITLLDAYLPERKFNEITWIEINGYMHYDKKVNTNTIKQLEECFSEESIIIPKRKKRGIKNLDIAPHIKDLEFELKEHIEMKAKISAQNPTLNAEDLMSAVCDELKPVYTDMKRIAFYDSNMIIFR